MLHDAAHACSDDALWLVSAVVEYVRETGSLCIIDKELPYADILNERDNARSESVYEHLKRILDFSERMVGKHGICQGLRADWNDCLNLGGGESALVSCLHLWALDNFIALAEFLGRAEDAAHYRQIHKKVMKRCEKELWVDAGNGKGWFLRGFTKHGKPIGTNTDVEGKVHLESNAWAVIAGVGGAEKGALAMDSVKEYLETPWGLALNAPAYTQIDDDVGFVTRVYPGLKENASVFSHPNPWAWVAECKLGRGDRAMEFYNALCPARQNNMIEKRTAETY
jgi:N,N'-diacetylchitobiose phosphorylase